MEIDRINANNYIKAYHVQTTENQRYRKNSENPPGGGNLNLWRDEDKNYIQFLRKPCKQKSGVKYLKS